MKTFTFQEFKNIRKETLFNYRDNFLSRATANDILISAPHGVSQLRLGKMKVAELGTIPIAIILANETNTNLILKTKNNNDDANFDQVSPYRDEIKKYIEDHNIKYIFDVHGMAKSRPYDINLGINFGQNIKNNMNLFNTLVQNLENEGFSVSIDQPFAAGPQTISGYFANTYNVWTIQIEINCSITNEVKNIDKCNNLIKGLIDTINSINNL